jgi:cation transport regulator ChaB
MPFESISELPKSVRNLPSRAKALYMKAYNGCWEDLESTEDDETGEWVKSEEVAGRRSRHVIRHRKSGVASQAKAHA